MEMVAATLTAWNGIQSQILLGPFLLHRWPAGTIRQPVRFAHLTSAGESDPKFAGRATGGHVQ